MMRRLRQHVTSSRLIRGFALWWFDLVHSIILGVGIGLLGALPLFVLHASYLYSRTVWPQTAGYVMACDQREQSRRTARFMTVEYTFLEEDALMVHRTEKQITGINCQAYLGGSIPVHYNPDHPRRNQIIVDNRNVNEAIRFARLLTSISIVGAFLSRNQFQKLHSVRERIWGAPLQPPSER